MCCKKAQIAVKSKNSTPVTFILLDNKHILQIINTIIIINLSCIYYLNEDFVNVTFVGCNHSHKLSSIASRSINTSHTQYRVSTY
jgi:hypothetical protein